MARKLEPIEEMSLSVTKVEKREFTMFFTLRT
jgi:hypothetical protein